MDNPTYDFASKLNDARATLVRQFLQDLAAECQETAEIASAALVEARNSDGSSESMLRFAQAAHVASEGLRALAQDAAVQATVVYDTPLRTAASAIGTSPNTINRWRERGRAERPEKSPTQWWVNEADVMPSMEDSEPDSVADSSADSAPSDADERSDD